MGNQQGALSVMFTRLYIGSKFYGQAERAISNGKLNVSLRFHTRPIDVVVYHGPS